MPLTLDELLMALDLRSRVSHPGELLLVYSGEWSMIRETCLACTSSVVPILPRPDTTFLGFCIAIASPYDWAAEELVTVGRACR